MPLLGCIALRTIYPCPCPGEAIVANNSSRMAAECAPMVAEEVAKGQALIVARSELTEIRAGMTKIPNATTVVDSVTSRATAQKVAVVAVVVAEPAAGNMTTAALDPMTLNATTVVDLVTSRATAQKVVDPEEVAAVAAEVAAEMKIPSATNAVGSDTLLANAQRVRGEAGKAERVDEKAVARARAGARTSLPQMTRWMPASMIISVVNLPQKQPLPRRARQKMISMLDSTTTLARRNLQRKLKLRRSLRQKPRTSSNAANHSAWITKCNGCLHTLQVYKSQCLQVEASINTGSGSIQLRYLGGIR